MASEQSPKVGTLTVLASLNPQSALANWSQTEIKIPNLISIVALSTLRLEDLRSGSNITLRNSDIGFRDATSTEAENKVQSGLFLDVVVSQRATVFELLASEDEALLIRWNTFLILDLAFNHIDGIGGFNLKPCVLIGVQQPNN